MKQEILPFSEISIISVLAKNQIKQTQISSDKDGLANPKREISNVECASEKTKKKRMKIVD